jgi:hypothetical protein
MNNETYTTLITSTHHQLDVAKHEYHTGRIKLDTLQLVAKHIRAIQNQIVIEYVKAAL